MSAPEGMDIFFVNDVIVKIDAELHSELKTNCFPEKFISENESSEEYLLTNDAF